MSNSNPWRTMGGNNWPIHHHNASSSSSKQDQNREIFHTLAANLSQITHRQKELTRSLHQPNLSGASSQTPEWLMEAPSDMEQKKLFNGRYCHYCSKCGKNGRWVCTDTDATHEDRLHSTNPSPFAQHTSTPDFYEHNGRSSRSPSQYRNYDSSRQQSHWESQSHSRSPYQPASYSPTSSPWKQVRWNLHAPPTPVAQLSLLDSINNFLND